MSENYVEEAPTEALQKVAKGNVHFTANLYKVSDNTVETVFVLTWGM
jgi:hypothetical protein